MMTDKARWRSLAAGAFSLHYRAVVACDGVRLPDQAAIANSNGKTIGSTTAPNSDGFGTGATPTAAMMG